MKHWFYILDGSEEYGWRIHTYGLGNRPIGKHWYETTEDLESAAKGFIEEGYELAKDERIK